MNTSYFSISIFYFEIIMEAKQVEKPKTIARNKRKQKLLLWKLATVFIGILLIISIFTGGFENIKSAKITGQEAAEKSIKYINQNLLQGQATAKLNGVEESGGLYLLKLDIGGQVMDSYTTKDGKLLFPQAINMDQAPSTPEKAPATKPATAPATDTNVPKSDKPDVELFVMSHCPYGTQMEKGILPVAKELKDKIDFEVKFVNYAMHGEKELQEQLRQYCIQKEYNSKYLAYLGKFLEADDSQGALKSVGLSDSDIADCVKEADETYKVTELFNDPQKTGWAGRFPPFKVHDAENQKYGVRGSPTLIVNGKQVQTGRDAQSLLNAICSAFSDKPEECNTDMSSFGNPAPGFGFGTQGGSAASAGCGA
jgi:glutaredoxin